MWAVAGIDSQNKEALAHEDDAKMTQILPIKMCALSQHKSANRKLVYLNNTQFSVKRDNQQNWSDKKDLIWSF